MAQAGAWYLGYVTAPNPKGRQSGPDAGQVGWRLHAVWCSPVGVVSGPSLCGVHPAHGWSVDLFIEHECKRCLHALRKRAEEPVRWYVTPLFGADRLLIADGLTYAAALGTLGLTPTDVYTRIGPDPADIGR